VRQPGPYRAVLFDFDGTLGDSYPAIAASVNHVRALHHLGPLAVDEVRRHVGRGVEYLLAHTVPGGDLAADAAAYRAHHPSVFRAGTRLMPGAAEVLVALHCRGLRLGVCSNMPVAFTRELLAYLGVAACNWSPGKPFISATWSWTSGRRGPPAWPCGSSPPAPTSRKRSPALSPTACSPTCTPWRPRSRREAVLPGSAPVFRFSLEKQGPTLR
jgi:hypothetical protein